MAPQPRQIPQLPGAMDRADLSNYIIALGNTYTVTPTLINEFRASFSRQYMTTHPSHPFPESINAQSAVQKELAPLRIPTDPFFPIPTWSISTPSGGRLRFGLDTW